MSLRIKVASNHSNPESSGRLKGVARLSTASLEVLVSERGADPLSIRTTVDDVEALWTDGRSPAKYGSDDETGFFDAYPGGVQELFPNAGPLTTVNGAQLPFHGESARRDWVLDNAPDGRALNASVHLRRLPYSASKSIVLHKHEPRLDIESTIVNECTIALPYHWALHPAFSTTVTAAPAVLIAQFLNLAVGPESFGEHQAHSPRTPLESAARGDAMEVELEPPAGGPRTLLMATHVCRLVRRGFQEHRRCCGRDVPA